MKEGGAGIPRAAWGPPGLAGSTSQGTASCRAWKGPRALGPTLYQALPWRISAAGQGSLGTGRGSGPQCGVFLSLLPSRSPAEIFPGLGERVRPLTTPDVSLQRGAGTGLVTQQGKGGSAPPPALSSGAATRVDEGLILSRAWACEGLPVSSASFCVLSQLLHRATWQSQPVPSSQL